MTCFTNYDAFLQDKNYRVQMESTSNDIDLLYQKNVDNAVLFQENSALPSYKAPILMPNQLFNTNTTQTLR